MWSGLKETNMARPLSPNIVKAVDRLFAGESKAEVVRLLTEQCADNLPNEKNSDEYELEDLRFAVLKISGGDIEKLRDAVRLANADTRDLSFAAGSLRKYKHQLLGRELERNPISDKIQRILFWDTLKATTAFVTFFVLRLFEASGGTLLAAGLLLLAGFVALSLLVSAQAHNGTRKEIEYHAFSIVGIPAGLGFLAAIIIRWIASAIQSLF
jgi:hypothetical protein